MRTLVACLFLATSAAAQVEPLPALPMAVTNNAVAQLDVDGRLLLFSFMGVGKEKTWDAITRRAFMLELGKDRWQELPPVPGQQGRLAAVAAGAAGKVYVFGGYTVAADGHEETLANVDIFDPETNSWSRGTDIPLPVDDSVAGVYQDRYVYLVGGWSQDKNVRNVQLYDTKLNEWRQAASILGTPVFGHAGGLAAGSIVYCDGAYPDPDPEGKAKYVASDECWQGKIGDVDLSWIDWERLPRHPGRARYRTAAGASRQRNEIYFSGGTDNPYNYDGVGYDGRPSEPVDTTFAWDAEQEAWVIVDWAEEHPSMDHRGLLITSGGLVTVGGTRPGQRVTDRVVVRKLGTSGGRKPDR